MFTIADFPLNSPVYVLSKNLQGHVVVYKSQVLEVRPSLNTLKTDLGFDTLPPISAQRLHFSFAQALIIPERFWRLVQHHQPLPPYWHLAHLYTSVNGRPLADWIRSFPLYRVPKYTYLEN